MYEGHEPYLFVSYSRKDAAVMEEVCGFLDRSGIRYWYDRGILVGSEWSKVLAARLREAFGVLLLLSSNSADSTWVKNEINFAISRKKPIHIVILDGYVPSDDDDILLMLGRIHMIPKNSYGFEGELLAALPNDLRVSSSGSAATANTADPASQLAIANSLYNEGKYEEAVSWYFRSASQGNADAQFRLGLCSRSGIGTPKDSSAAVTWFSMSAEQGDPRAQNMLGEALFLGEGILMDRQAAARLFHEAAEKNVIDAIHNLGVCYKTGSGVLRDMAEAARLFHIAASRGSSDSQLELGAIAYSSGTEPGYKEAVQWFRMSAEQGNPTARLFLGKCCKDGLGTPKDLPEAARLFALSAEAGDLTAKRELGMLYYSLGEGGDASYYAEAARIFTDAAKEGHAEAVCDLGVCYYYGNGVEKDPETAAKLFTTAAEAGVTDAMLNIAVCLETGFGVKKNPRAAKEWRKRAQK